MKIEIEDKELLLKDLCARLPYNVICKDDNINVIGTLSQIGLHYNMCTLDKDNSESESCYIYNCKPYLFPLSSMTKEQRKEYTSLLDHIMTIEGDVCDVCTVKSINWLLENHFDINNLIPLGLAKDATGLNIY